MHVVSLTANIHGLTLGEAAQKLNQALVAAGDPPKGVSVTLRGEIPPLEQTLSGLRIGLLLAVLVIFLLLSANFQSIRLALAIVLTIPAVLCGVLLMLLITGTTLNVQSFMGAIMAIGIAVANSILLVTFSERARHEGRNNLEAAQQGAASRLRAVLAITSSVPARRSTAFQALLEVLRIEHCVRVVPKTNALLFASSFARSDPDLAPTTTVDKSGNIRLDICLECHLSMGQPGTEHVN